MADLIFRNHALRRMFERAISVEAILEIINRGEIIQQYPSDTPYPSRLMLGWIKGKPLHLVCADDPDERNTIIITVYEPDPALWGPEFKRKKQ